MSLLRRIAFRPGPLRIALTVGLLVLAGLPLGAGASLPPGRTGGPELVSPLADVTVAEGAVQFAWKALPGASHQWLLVSREPFETTGWTSLPRGAAIEAFEMKTPVASLEDIGIHLEEDARLYWAVAAQDGAAGRTLFSPVRTFFALRKFSNRVEQSPLISTSPIRTLDRKVSIANDRIRLQAGYTIDPKQGEPVLPARMREAAAPVTGARTYIAYYGDADPAKTRRDILAAGGTIVSYVPDHAFLVRMNASAQLTIDNDHAWVGTYQPGYKLSPKVDVQGSEIQTVDVMLFLDADFPAVKAAVKAQGMEILTSSDNGINKAMRVRASADRLAALAQMGEVQWIEPHVPIVEDNASAQWVVQTRVTNNRRLWDLGIKGQGQTVTTSDGGINVAHDAFRDPAVAIPGFGDYPTHRKVIAYKNGSDDPSVVFGEQPTAYHGSHTGGSITGFDDYVGGINANDGMAPLSKFYFMDIGPASGTSVIPTTDLNDLFQPAYTGNAGGQARISSNSWGAPVSGAYTFNSLAVDQFMYNHPDFLIFFSSGNNGPTASSVGAPASAKNLVTVGATFNGASNGSFATFTSQGPTADGRRKPTILAPGNGITSVNGATTNGYVSNTGTSMATPIAAGATALIRQYCMDGWYPTGAPVPANGFVPSGALLKAMVINSGDAPLGTRHMPGNDIGWGRIDCDTALYFAGDARRLLLVDQTQGLGHGQSISYQVNVTNTTVPLEVSLVWTDYPGNPLVTNQLVNNLNLSVTNGVDTYPGNSFNVSFSITGGAEDTKNTEECVRVKFPTAGLWTIQVDGANVPIGPQAFGLCITGGIGTTAGTLALDRTSYGSASTVGIKVTDTDGGPSVNVTLTSPTEPGGETLTIPGSNGIYTATLPLSPFAGSVNNGTLQVSNGDVITATYQDASTLTGNQQDATATLTATAQVSFSGPVITNVTASNKGAGSVDIAWTTTNKSSNSRVYYGATPSLGSVTTLDPAAVIAHVVPLTGLTTGQTYYYDVESQDLNGNLTRDDNAGSHYAFTVTGSGDVLLVLGGDDLGRFARYQSSFDATGWSYDVWRGTTADNPVVGDLNSGMRSYRAVVWQVGLETYPPFTDNAMTAITSYMDGGGRIATVGNDIAWSMGFNDGGATNPYYTPARATFLQNTLHTTFNADPAAWVGVTGIASDPISGAYTTTLPYAEHRSGASGDEIDAAPGTGTSSYDWRSKDGNPGTPDDCGFRWESAGPLGSPGTGVWANTPSRHASMYFEWSAIEFESDPSNARNDILDKTLNWLTGRAHPLLSITQPNGGESITTDSYNITWSETLDGAGAASRTLEYSLDNGASWSLITNSAGPSPYSWDLTAVPNTVQGLVRVTVTDNGTPSLKGFRRSVSAFAIQRAAGDVAGPGVTAGSFNVSPNPINNQAPATLQATVTDLPFGGANVAAAEWSFGDIAQPAGSGTAMTGTFTSPTVTVSANLTTGTFPPGARYLWVRGRDANNNWGAARGYPVVVNGVQPTGVTNLPKAFELSQNAPNPVQFETTISFAVPKESDIKLAIFDVQGRQVRALVDGKSTPGYHHVSWDRTDARGRQVQPGVYYVRMNAPTGVLQKKIVTLH